MTEPWPTLTLNLVDNPLVVFLRFGNDHQLEWCLRLHPDFVKDPAAVKAAFLELNQNCVGWLGAIVRETASSDGG